MKKASFWKKVGGGSVFLATVGVMIFASLFGRGVVPKVHADRGCSVATIAGTPYGLVSAGSITGVGPFAATGLITSDRAGNLITSLTFSVNGVPGTETLTGTIIVNSDCTFTNSFSDGSTAAGVIVEGGREVDFSQTTPGETISGVAKRVRGSED